jgi:hypothetical protein
MKESSSDMFPLIGLLLLLLISTCRLGTSWSLSMLPRVNIRGKVATTRPRLFVLHSRTANNIPTSTDMQEKNNTNYKFQVVAGPDVSTKPKYEDIHGPLGKFMDRLFLTVFRAKLAEHVGIDSKLPKVNKRIYYIISISEDTLRLVHMCTCSKLIQPLSSRFHFISFTIRMIIWVSLN